MPHCLIAGYAPVQIEEEVAMVTSELRRAMDSRYTRDTPIGFQLGTGGGPKIAVAFKSGGCVATPLTTPTEPPHNQLL